MFIKLHVDDTRLILNVNEIETIQEIKNGSKYHDYCTKYGAKTIIKVKDNRFLFREFYFFESALALLPAFAGVLLHVGHLVALVDDFEAEDGLDDVFEGDDALERAELVDGVTITSSCCDLLYF